MIPQSVVRMVTYWDGWNQYYFDHIKGWEPSVRREHIITR